MANCQFVGDLTLSFPALYFACWSKPAVAPPWGKQMQSRRSVRGAVVWLTGLSGAGKSTLATRLEMALSSQGLCVVQIDGDELRRGLCSDLGFGPSDRSENVRRAAEASILAARCGIICVVALISPYAADRARAKALVEAEGVPFFEVFVDAPITLCQERDPKGLYRLARSGTIKQFTGVSDPYEVPAAPDAHVRTDLLKIDEGAQYVLGIVMAGLRTAS